MKIPAKLTKRGIYERVFSYCIPHLAFAAATCQLYLTDVESRESRGGVLGVSFADWMSGRYHMVNSTWTPECLDSVDRRLSSMPPLRLPVIPHTVVLPFDNSTLLMYCREADVTMGNGAALSRAITDRAASNGYEIDSMVVSGCDGERLLYIFVRTPRRDVLFNERRTRIGRPY